MVSKTNRALHIYTDKHDNNILQIILKHKFKFTAFIENIYKIIIIYSLTINTSFIGCQKYIHAFRWQQTGPIVSFDSQDKPVSFTRIHSDQLINVMWWR